MRTWRTSGLTRLKLSTSLFSNCFSLRDSGFLSPLVKRETKELFSALWKFNTALASFSFKKPIRISSKLAMVESKSLNSTNPLTDVRVFVFSSPSGISFFLIVMVIFCTSFLFLMMLDNNF